MAINPLELVFRTDSRAPLELVFGDDAGSGSAPEYSLSGGGQITGLRRADASLVYDYNVERPALAWRHARMQQGASAVVAARTRWQRSDGLTVALRSSSDPGLPTTRGVRSGAQQADALTRLARVASEIGVPVVARGHSRFEQTVPLHAAARSLVQSGRPVIAHVLTAYEAVIRLSRYARGGYQAAVPVLTLTHQRLSDGIPLLPSWRQGYQAGRLPPYGHQPHVTPPGRDDWCYVPTDPIELAFRPDDRAPLELLFECDRHAVPPPLGPIIVPVRKTYVAHNNVTLYRLPAGVEFQASAFSLDVDADSWTFTWSASLHSSARAHLVRTDPAERVQVQAVVNGINLRLVIDSMGRSRAFPEDRIQVSGRGRSAELGDTALSFGNTAARTAQQLMQDVLTVNGVSLGWDLDWQIEDWLVPANTWLFQGSYIAALQDIAGAVGAYIQPHFTDQVLRVLPRYPVAPWNWAADLDADIILPVGATSVEGVEEVIRPDYNQVHVGGLKAPAVFGPVKRAGTAGDIEPDPVLHALITATEAHRQRGLAVLSDTGLQEHVTVKTLLLPETGIIMPGKVVSYVSDDKTRKGIVRKTSLQMQSWPVLHQEIGVETHVID